MFVVPDAAINLVNFAALPLGESEYLVDRGPVLHYLSAERDLLIDAAAPGAGSGLLAVSNPDFDTREMFAELRPQSARSEDVQAAMAAAIYRGPRSACGSFRSMRFEALPASGWEAKEVVELWNAHATRTPRGSHDAPSGGAILLSGPASNESSFKRNARGHQVLHLATHGFFLGGKCSSALDSPGASAGTGAAEEAITRENPLLLSGLALAGANNREVAGADEDDGILTAEEIATLDLRGTEWAVLSACDTGIGEIRAGEGVFGLRRAFQMAGARTVIMSLWPVEDEAARRWMTALYRHRFVAGESTAESVNGASLELLKQRRVRGESTHPFYWAGFIAAGDWR